MNEKDFIMNFLQEKKGFGTSEDNTNNKPKSVNENLSEQGLSPWFEPKDERRQRATIWLMMDQDGDGHMQFSEWLALQRYGRLFNHLRQLEGVDKQEVSEESMRGLLAQSHMLNSNEIKLLTAMQEALKKGLKFNFKQFVAWMQIDKVFHK